MSVLRSSSARSGPTPINRSVGAKPITQLWAVGAKKRPKPKRPVAVPFLSDSESEDDAPRLPLPPSKRRKLTNVMQARLQLNIDESCLKSAERRVSNRTSQAALSCTLWIPWYQWLLITPCFFQAAENAYLKSCNVNLCRDQSHRDRRRRKSVSNEYVTFSLSRSPAVDCRKSAKQG